MQNEQSENKGDMPRILRYPLIRLDDAPAALNASDARFSCDVKNGLERIFASRKQ